MCRSITFVGFEGSNTLLAGVDVTVISLDLARIAFQINIHTCIHECPSFYDVTVNEIIWNGRCTSEVVFQIAILIVIYGLEMFHHVYP